ncbi:MAG: hypothetical protein SAK29_10245 [Scytonema sp. PMC 1069.18]|nr:hypothetical protein [Scytonema sp. PMC 1069.18]MEC4884792.1 hypothetical protein [Scytonema sp. PMC 1070.18]
MRNAGLPFEQLRSLQVVKMIQQGISEVDSESMKYSDLKAIFTSEQTNRGLLVIGLDREGRQIKVLFHITTEPKTDWEAISVQYL